MNVVALMGRLTKDPEIRYTQGAEPLCIARYTLAVDSRRKGEDGKFLADFIQCVAMGKNGEFAEKYFRQGMRIAVTGRWQTGSYTNKEGVKVYTNDCYIATQDFAQSKSENATQASDDFVPVSDDMELPFN